MSAPPPPAEHLGPYRLLEPLGEGGMGIVYRAVRDDEEYRRQVAIKVIRQGFESAELRRRFRLERELLARLEHPGIARLYDGGTTDDDRPYLVMEHVDGHPLHRFADENGLGVEARLALFLELSGAVAHAHRHLLVHRDLKPENVLVTGDGALKLLDFGIAKPVDGEAAAPTRTGIHPLSPAYASPEQLRGEPLTTASDVYALGVMLYELLTGTRPHDADAAIPPHELARAICEDEPDRMSTAARRRGDRERARRLAGDLDAVALKALAKSPAERYGSAAELAEDLRRHLAAEPVEARPQTTSYRAAKFLRRHLAATVAAALFLAMILAFLAAAAVQASRLERERDRAEQSLAFLQNLFGDELTALGDTEVTIREVFTAGAARIDTELAGEPLAQAELYDVFGVAMHGLGLHREAETLVEKGLALRERHLAAPAPEIGDSLHHLGAVLSWRGEYERSAELLRRALEIRRRDAPPSDVAKTLVELAYVIRGLGRTSESEELMEEASAVYETSTRPEDPLDQAEVFGAMAEAKRSQRDYAATETYHRRALEIRRENLAPGHAAIGQSLAWLGASLLVQGRHIEAEPFLRKALRTADDFPPDHPLRLRTTMDLADALNERGELREAEMLYWQALEILAERYGFDHPRTMWFQLSLAGDLLYQGFADKAAQLEREANAFFTGHFDENHPSTATLHCFRAEILDAQGRFTDAEELFTTCHQIYAAALGEDHFFTAWPQVGLGRQLRRRGELDRAEKLLRDALEKNLRTVPEGHWRIAQNQGELGLTLAARGELEDAEALLLASLEAFADPYDNCNPRLETEARRRLRDVYLAAGRPAKAAAILEGNPTDDP